MPVRKIGQGQMDKESRDAMDERLERAYCYGLRFMQSVLRLSAKYFNFHE